MAEQRLIDANALLRDMEAYLALKPGMAGTMYEFMQFVALDCVETAPAVDAKPVVHAHWERYPDCGVTKCSNCGWSIEECWDSKWCPECGAQMDEEEG